MIVWELKIEDGKVLESRNSGNKRTIETEGSVLVDSQCETMWNL